MLGESRMTTMLPVVDLARARAFYEEKLGLAVPSPSSFGEDTRHRLYVTSLEGPVYRLVSR